MRSTYGAGLLSSGGELAYSVADPRPQRLPFDQLMRDTAPDFTPIYARLRDKPHDS